MRKEMTKVSVLWNINPNFPPYQGTKEGERIKKIVSDGGLVPFELTVQILINALLATPSKVSKICI